MNMMNTMKRALVTGGTKGIGRSIVEMLMTEGYFVTVTYAHDEASALKFQDSFADKARQLELIKADQSCKEDMRWLMSHLKSQPVLDCLVFNAGITLRKGLTDFTDEEWGRVMQVNVNAPVFLIRDLHDHLSQNARIVFIGSEMGVYPHGTSLAYGVTKSAVHALARNLVKFFEGTGTTVNAIAPGFVETDWQKDKPQEIRNNICRKTALGRFATTEEIADAVRFVIRNSFVNGTVIEVSGGYNYK